MLKRLARVAIRVLPWIIGGAAVGGAIVFVASKQHRAAEEYEAAREKRCASSFPLDPEKQDACNHERDSGDNYLLWWYVLVAWPDGITTWAIIATGFVIGWQSWETRKAAKASLLNAAYLVNLERPYLYLKLEYADRSASGPDEEYSQWYKIAIVNRGRTIAEIVSASDPMLHLVNEGERISFPTAPATVFRKRIPPVPVLPGGEDSVDITQIWDDIVFEYCGSSERKHRFIDGKLLMYATGVILFRDLLRPPTADPHEMHWCCRVRYDNERLCVYPDGPEKYNYQT